MKEIKRVLVEKENVCEACGKVAMGLSGSYKFPHIEGSPEVKEYICKYCLNKQTFFTKSGKRVMVTKYY